MMTSWWCDGLVGATAPIYIQPKGGILTQLDHTLIALADPTRRKLLARLSEGEARVTELAAPLPMSLNAVSKHIKMLERAKLVRRRVRGRDHYLSLDPRPLDRAALWIETQRAQWTQRLRKLDEILQEEDRT